MGSKVRVVTKTSFRKKNGSIIIVYVLTYVSRYLIVLPISKKNVPTYFKVLIASSDSFTNSINKYASMNLFHENECS